MNNKSTLAALVVGLSVCIMSFVLLDVIGALGRHIPQADPTGDYIYGVLWALLLGIGIMVWPVKNSDKQALAIAWTVRCAVTLVFMLFYEYSYDNDSFYYFYDSTNSGAWEWTGLTLGVGTTNFWRLTWLHAQFLPNSFHMMKVSCSMIGFIATYIFYRAAVRFLKGEDIRIFFVLSLFPSMIFWSSTLGKDPIVLLGIAVYVYGVSAWYDTGKAVHLAVIFAGIWLALSIRIWLGPILIAPLTVFMLARVRGLITKSIFICIIAGAFFFAGERFREQFNVQTSNDLVSTIEGRAHSTGWAGNTALNSGRKFTSMKDVLVFMPIGAFTALFRPLPGELNSIFGILAGSENLVLLVLLFQAFRRTRMSELKDPRLLWALVLILTWSSIYGFISYQNLGAASRFRLQILPVILATLLFLRRDRHVNNDYARQ